MDPYTRRAAGLEPYYYRDHQPLWKSAVIVFVAGVLFTGATVLLTSVLTVIQEVVHG